MDTDALTELPGELRVLVRPLANARRDALNGAGLAATLDEVRDSLRRLMRALHYNVLVLTEFNRGLLAQEYDDFVTFVGDELGLVRHLGFKKDLPIEAQRAGATEDDAHMETIVFTSLPHSVVLERVLLSHTPPTDGDRERVNGAVALRLPGFVVVAVHASLVLGNSSEHALRRTMDELQHVMYYDARVLAVGDFNMTDALAASLKAMAERHDADNDVEDVYDRHARRLLNFYAVDRAQPDFVCGPDDLLDEHFFALPEHLPEGMVMRVFDRRDDGRVRIVSALGKRSRGWDTARYFHPLDDTVEITGMTHDKVVAAASADRFVFDHAACFVTAAIDPSDAYDSAGYW